MGRQFTKIFKEDALSYVHDYSDLNVNAFVRNPDLSSNILHTWAKKSKKNDELYRGSRN